MVITGGWCVAKKNKQKNEQHTEGTTSHGQKKQTKEKKKNTKQNSGAVFRTRELLQDCLMVLTPAVIWF